jgi:hypothetical protein
MKYRLYASVNAEARVFFGPFPKKNYASLFG